MDLTPEQNHVLDEVLKFHKPIQKISGYAGTGKSFLVSVMKEKLPNFSVCTYTGKAVDVLRKKGISDACTIHSLIYKPLIDPNTNQIALDENGSPIFILNPSIECSGVIIDEASMIGKDIYEDLCSFNIPLIFTGDGGQLEPIGDSNINLMANPDYTLETIHRNAGEIAYFAEFIRNGYRPAAFATRSSGKVQFIGKYEAENYFTEVDQIICAYNKTRVKVNRIVREILGYNENWPVENDRIMCLKNNKEKGLFNGMQGGITKMYGKKPKNKIEFYANNTNFEVRFDPKQFNAEKYEIGHDKNGPIPFDYAYCITCHRSQGSEYNKVMVLEQKCQAWSHIRWAYTAASRAKESVIWVEGY